MDELSSKIGELCICCTNFIGKVSDIPNLFEYGVEDFATCAQIEANAITCALCKIFWSSLQPAAPNFDLNITLRIHWLVSRPGPTFIMLDTPQEDPSEDFFAYKLLSAQDSSSSMLLKRRYLISYERGKKSPLFSEFEIHVLLPSKYNGAFEVYIFVSKLALAW